MDDSKLLKYIKRGINDTEYKKEIINEIKSDDENLKQFISLKNVSALIGKHNCKNLDKDYRKLKRKMRRDFKGEKIFLNIVKYAAIIIISALSAYSYFGYEMEKNKPPVVYHKVSCPLGQISTVQLADGSTVWLNSGTSIEYPSNFSKTNRSLKLSGEAYFDIVKDVNNPFIVNSEHLDIKVYGTGFNISAYKNDNYVEAVLVNGKISVLNKNKDQIAKLKPNQMALLTKHNNQLKVSTTDTRFYTSWKEGKMSFFNEKLEVITRKLERWYNVEFIYLNNGIKHYKFTGTILRNKPLDQVLKIIEKSFSIKSRTRVNTDEPNIIILSK